MDNSKQIVGGLKTQEEIVDVAACTENGSLPSEGKWYRVRIGEQYHIFLKQFVTGREVLETAGITQAECYWLYIKLKGCDFERVAFAESINLAKPGIEHFLVKPTEVFSYYVDNEPEMTDRKSLSPNEILKLAGIDSKTHYLVQRIEGQPGIVYAWNPDEPITMDCKALEFVSVKWLDTVDIEEYGKYCKPVPPARKYRIRIDKQYHVIDKRFISREDIVALGGKPQVKYNVYKYLSGTAKPIRVEPGTNVDLTERCLLRLVLQPKEQQEGRGNRQQFSLPEEDMETLEQMTLPWETVTSGNHWLIIYGYPIPDGYNVKQADIALMIPPSYPASQIDMAYFSPALVKKNGRPIGAIANQSIDGKTFQRWSRHRAPDEWMPGVDSVATHLCLVDNWLIQDLTK